MCYVISQPSEAPSRADDGQGSSGKCSFPGGPAYVRLHAGTVRLGAAGVNQAKLLRFRRGFQKSESAMRAQFSHET